MFLHQRSCNCQPGSNLSKVPKSDRWQPLRKIAAFGTENQSKRWDAGNSMARNPEFPENGGVADPGGGSLSDPTAPITSLGKRGRTNDAGNPLRKATPPNSPKRPRPNSMAATGTDGQGIRLLSCLARRTSEMKSVGSPPHSSRRRQQRSLHLTRALKRPGSQPNSVTPLAPTGPSGMTSGARSGSWSRIKTSPKQDQVPDTKQDSEPGIDRTRRQEPLQPRTSKEQLTEFGKGSDQDHDPGATQLQAGCAVTGAHGTRG